MNLMLVAIFVAVGLGLLTKEFGRRTRRLVVLLPVALTLLYFVHPRYMT